MSIMRAVLLMLRSVGRISDQGETVVSENGHRQGARTETVQRALRWQNEVARAQTAKWRRKQPHGVAPRAVA